MKYCKSKRGYFYKVVGDKKTRISIEEYKAGCKKQAMKGGFDEFGRIEQSDFKLKENKNTEPDENSISIIKNIHGIPHVFFGYEKRIEKYRYVMYYLDKLNGNSIHPIIVQKLEDDGRISQPFSHIKQEILRIPAPILLHLCYEFIHHYNTRNKSRGMKIIYEYLINHVVQRLKRTGFTGRKAEQMLDEIRVESKVSNLPEFVEMTTL